MTDLWGNVVGWQQAALGLGGGLLLGFGTAFLRGFVRRLRRGRGR